MSIYDISWQRTIFFILGSLTFFVSFIIYVYSKTFYYFVFVPLIFGALILLHCYFDKGKGEAKDNEM